ncbi:hypothetical protein [Bradyrhizobium ottawaense]|uniref:hypothetical protein n=1 Tax=Bradyrhizobium ottawaense TaxID=931866 RepID=UPI001BA55BB8|nr:hypothetical protein [Bradyrhizobium ottawaense]MBR1335253.1 hypothetical protein [Bradyrhizobium ottawaense]
MAAPPRSFVGIQDENVMVPSEAPADCLARVNEWKDENGKNPSRNRNNKAPEQLLLIHLQAASDLVDRVTANQFSPTFSAGESACARARQPSQTER